jgi:hypothetical protein
MHVRCERITIKARSLSLVTFFHAFFSYPTLHILTALPIIDIPVYILASLYSQSASSSMQIHLQVFLTLLTHSQQRTTMRLITLTTFLIPTLAARAEINMATGWPTFLLREAAAMPGSVRRAVAKPRHAELIHRGLA